MAKLTERQRGFIDQFMIDRDAGKAATRAGYNADMGRQLLRKPHISSEIARRQGEIEAKSNEVAVKTLQETGASTARVLQEITALAFSDIGEVMDFSGDNPKLKAAKDISENTRRAISSVKVKRYTEGAGEAAREVEVQEFRFWDKLTALEKLGKHLGMFKEEKISIETVEALLALLPARLASDVRVSIAFAHEPKGHSEDSGASAPGADQIAGAPPEPIPE